MNRVKSYNVWVWSMLSFTGVLFLFATQFFSCQGAKKPVDTTEQIYTKKYQSQLENFAFLVKEAHNNCFPTSNQSCISEQAITPLSSASGVVLSSSSSHIFIITANHFCESSISEKMMGETKIRIFIGDTSRLANIIIGSKKADLCLLSALRFKDENFKTTKLASRMPLIGDKLVNIAAPDGMASPNTRLMFNGNFAGCEVFNCVFTIPATFGSSGSAIYNEKGELVSILVAAAVNFENVSMGPHIDTLHVLVETVEESIDIY